MSRKKRRYRKQQNGASSISAAGKISASARTESRSSAVVRADKPMRVEAAASSTPRSGGNRKSDHRQDKISDSEEVSASARTESRSSAVVRADKPMRVEAAASSTPRSGGNRRLNSEQESEKCETAETENIPPKGSSQATETENGACGDKPKKKKGRNLGQEKGSGKSASEKPKHGSASSVFQKRKTSLLWIRLRLFLKINLMIVCIIGIACCFAGIKVNEYFETKTGLTIRDCFENGRLAVAESRPEDFRSQKATNIYAAGGKKISTVYKTKENTYLTYEEIPEYVVNAFIAVEDRTFWKNEGYDLKGIIRVMIDFVKSGGSNVAGASTITQQLARQKYLTLDRTLSRKVAEIAAARDLTHMYTKEEIMEYYVNMCCFANGIFGIQDAAMSYFGKDVSKLTISEAAYLCAIPNWPEHYNPRKNPETAVTRRDKILADMLELGFISRPQYDKAVMEEMKIREPKKNKVLYDYETTYAIHCTAKYLMEMDGFDFEYAWDSDAAYQKYQNKYQKAYQQARDEVLNGGYDIYTSIDLKKQKAVQKAVNRILAEEKEKLENGIYKLQSSVTVIDNETGKVAAIIGGRKQKNIDSMFALNRAYQGYAQPGSTIKPIAVYAPAMEEGKQAQKNKNRKKQNSKGGKLKDAQERFVPDSVLRNINVSQAKTSTGDEISEMSGNHVYLRNAVERSLNGCAYWLMNEIGVKRSLSHLSEMGFQKICPSDYTLSASLGGLTYGTTTEEMANAYHTLSQSGLYTDTDCLVSVIDRGGKEIYKKPEPKRVYERDAADAMTDVMKGVLKHGTAASAAWNMISDIEAAGKTGTTNDNKAAWFCGYTPYYTIAVWVGCDTPETVASLQGATYPLQIWKDAMLALTDGKPKAEFAPLPEGMKEHRVSCTCSGRCTMDSINSSCLVCRNISDEASIDMVCKGRKTVSCICTDKCFGDEINENCPACVANPSKCTGTDSSTCVCIDRCTETDINHSCPKCSRSWTLCNAQETAECICTRNCIQHGQNKDCPVCASDTGKCSAKKDKESSPEEKPDKPEKPDEPVKPEESEKPEKPPEPEVPDKNEGETDTDDGGDSSGDTGESDGNSGGDTQTDDAEGGSMQNDDTGETFQQTLIDND